MLEYKVVELSQVTAEDLEEALNEWVGKGYILENCLFAMRESSRRPAMAFLVFTTRMNGNEEEEKVP